MSGASDSWRARMQRGHIARAESPAKVTPQRKPVDPELVAQALGLVPSVGRNTLPATGRCHTCDRRISGERRYCGPCLARR